MHVSLQSALSFQSYEDTQAYITALGQGHMELGTHRMQQVMHYLGNPQNTVPSIHVVGTNGKGSVSAMLSHIYQAAGYQVGLFTSPHLLHMRERIQVQNKAILGEPFVEAATAVFTAQQAILDEPLTYFEFINAMAFWYFRQVQTDIAIIEAGLGGRLDSTNVIEKPLAIVVTPISYDHTERLGPTLTHIATEKAGVFRAHVPIYSAQQTPEAWAVLQNKAILHQAPMFVSQANAWVAHPLEVTTQKEVLRGIEHQQTGQHYALGLLGRYQAQNMALALDVIAGIQHRLPVTPSALEHGLKQTRWPGRLQLFSAQNLIIDGSHNAAGINSLAETLQQDFAHVPLHLGLTLLDNRDPAILNPLLQLANLAHISYIRPSTHHAFHAAKHLWQYHQTQCLNTPSNFDISLTQFLDVPSNVYPTLRCLTGSLYTAGEALCGIPEMQSI